MARIEIPSSTQDEKPEPFEIVAAYPWGLAGAQNQHFHFSSGLNFSAAGNIWLEICADSGAVFSKAPFSR